MIPQGLFGHGTGAPPQSFAILEFLLARLIGSPNRRVRCLHLTESARVLKMGPGSDNFSVEIARHLPQGRLDLFDRQPEILEKARRKLQRSGLANTGFVQGTMSALPYRLEQFDVVVLVTVLGKGWGPIQCLGEIYRVLRPAGVLSITEQAGDPDFVSLPRTRMLVADAGFSLERVYGRGQHYTANFTKLRS